jgi:multidrug resistance efflux pump
MAKPRKRTFVIVALIAMVAVVSVVLGLRRSRLVLTGIVTTDETIVSSEIQGRLQELSVAPGDHVKRGQLLGRIAAAEQQADLAYSNSLAQSAAAVVDQSVADLRFQTEMTAQQIAQAEANVAAADAAVTQADADADLARANFERADNLRKQATNSLQEYDQARAANVAAKARTAAAHQQADAARAALGVAKAGAAQVAVRQAALNASRQQLAAAASQKDKAGVHVGYTEIHAPVDGIVNVRAALPGEVVNPGQAIVTLIDPANLWIRADIEESYVDRLHLGDKLTVRLPSGAEREATLFFRGVDAAYATQRDVSRTKRDIKTFELRLRCDNGDGSLAVGMTAYVTLPFAH